MSARARASGEDAARHTGLAEGSAGLWLAA
jgi:hypothetical protein